MKRWLTSALSSGVLLGGLLFGTTPPSALAMEEWCDIDPVVLVTTPAGNIVPLFVTTGAYGVQHAVTTQLAKITYTTRPF